MNIKKFEARTMKEALEMVKTQLGPDAVVLSAKEVTKGFGLGGAKSIEITAAYSENVLRNKQYVQSRMPEAQKNKFDRIAAKSQKEIIQKVVEEQILKSQMLKTPKDTAPKALFSASMGTKKYIEIDEDQLPKTQASVPRPTSYNRRASPQLANQVNQQLAMQATTYAGQQAHTQTNMQANMQASFQAQLQEQGAILTQQAQRAWGSMEVQSLKNEIEQLKELIHQFRSMPQNFVQAAPTTTTIQQHPGAEFGVNYDLSAQYLQLTRKGILPDVAADILVQAQAQLEPHNQKKPQVMEAWVGKYILNSVPVVSGGFEQFHFFVGPSGSGKSSSMIKLASQLVLQHKRRVALISADTIKVGADQQMKIFSEILNLPFISIRNPSDWNKVIPYLGQVDHVLVDFASLSMKTEDEFNYLKKMMPPVLHNMRTHLVLSAKSKDSDLLESVKRYEKIGIMDIIVTSLDEATQHGNIYNLARKQSFPFYAFGIGPKIPEDFERATAERVLDLILELTKTSNIQETTI